MGGMCCREDDKINPYSKKLMQIGVASKGDAMTSPGQETKDSFRANTQTASNNQQKIVVKIYDTEDEFGVEMDPYIRYFKNLDGFSQLNLNNSLYLCGANMENDTSGSYLLQFDPNKTGTSATSILISSINHHYYPTMLGYKNEYIIVIGGSKSKSTEIYNIRARKWKTLPELPEERYRCNAVADELTEYVYIFGGFNSELTKNASTILRLNMKHTLIWETLIVKNNSNLIARNSSGIVKFERSGVVYILGGKDNEDNSCDSIVEFELLSRQVTQSKKTLQSKTVFAQQTGADLNKADFFLFDENANIHKISRNDFNIIQIPFKHVLEDAYD